MPVIFGRFYRLLLLALVCLGQFALGQGGSLTVLRKVKPEQQRDPALEKAISAELGRGPMRYSFNRVNLNGAGEDQVLVYVSGGDQCGSGGCTALVFRREGAGYKLVTNISLAHTPIYVSAHKTAGWSDLVIPLYGGGRRPTYAVLRFNGKTYPDNPTVEPAKPFRPQSRVVAYLADEKLVSQGFEIPAH